MTQQQVEQPVSGVPRRRFPSPQWPKWALALLFLVDGAGFGTWAAHVAVFKQSLHLANGSLTLVLLCVIGGAIVAMPVMGQIIARYGSRRVVQVVAVSYFLTIALLGQTETVSYLIPVALLFGAAKGAFDVSVNAQVFAVETLWKRSLQGLFQGCWSVGGLLGASASSLMLHAGGTIRTDLSWAALVLGLCALPMLPLLVSETVKPHKASKFSWPDASLLHVAAIAFFGLMTEGSIADWAAVYLHSHVHVSLSMAAIGYAAFSVTMALSRFSIDWMVQRFSSKQILEVSGLLIAFGMGCALALPLWWPAIVGFVITGIGTATIVPVTFSVAGRNTTMGTGPAISALATIGYFGFLSGPPLIGSIAVLAGLRGALTIIVFAGLFIAAAPALFKFDNRQS